MSILYNVVQKPQPGVPGGGVKKWYASTATNGEADINALIAPRAHLGLAGLQDGLTPVEGLDIIDAELKKVYSEMGVPENWKLLRYDVGHQETAEGRREILKFLEQHLG